MQAEWHVILGGMISPLTWNFTVCWKLYAADFFELIVVCYPTYEAISPCMEFFFEIV